MSARDELPPDQPAPAKFVLGVDLDGVVVDFYRALRPIAAEWLGVSVGELTEEVTYGLPEWNLAPMGGYSALHRFAVTEREIFATAESISGAPAALRRLSEQDIRIRIITNRLFIKHFHKEAVQQTITWLDYHGVPYWDLCLMPDKAAVGADLYIDDTPHNVEALRKKGLRTIVLTNSTNRHLDPPRADTWEDAEQVVLEELKAWSSRPGAAKPPAGH